MTHLISNVLYGTAGIRISIPYIQRIIMVLYSNLGTYCYINREGKRDEESGREKDLWRKRVRERASGG